MTRDGTLDPRSGEWPGRLAFVRRVLSHSRYELTREDREELAQEALVDYLERSRSERPRNPEGLLRTIAHRKAVDLLRGRARWNRILVDSEGSESIPDPERGIDREVRRHLAESLPAIVAAYLEANHPDCLEHARTYFEDGSWRDLAAEKDARVNTVIQQWTRCRNEVVAHLRECGFGWALGEGCRD